MSRIGHWGRAALPALLLGATVAAGAELVLLDGQVLTGRSVKLEGELYLLALDGDEVLPLPAALVREVRQNEGPGAATTGPGSPDPIAATDPGSLLDPPLDPAASPDRPRLFVQLPDDGESASRFTQSILDPNWLPQSESAERPMLDVFEPSRFVDAPIDPDWALESGFGEPEGKAPFRPARFKRSPVRSDWRPEDGFSDGDR
jgi:hypothetical protein